MNNEEILVFRFKISDEEMKEIILKHLIMEGMIRDEREKRYFTGIERKGTDTFIEFAVKNGVLGGEK